MSDVATAVRPDEGRLRLIDSGVAPDLGRPPLELAGRRAVTAVRSASGHLLLISWEMPDGLARITRVLDGAPAGSPVGHVAAEAVDSITLVTASRHGAGRLQLVSWRLHPDGSFTRLSDSGTQAGALALVSMVSFGAPSRLVVTAVRTTRRTLKVVPWTVSETGAIVRHRGEGETDEPVAGISSARLLDADRKPVGLVTEAEASGGPRRVTAWTVAGMDRASGFVVPLRNGSGDLMLVRATDGAAGSDDGGHRPVVRRWDVVSDPPFHAPAADERPPA